MFEIVDQKMMGPRMAPSINPGSSRRMIVLARTPGATIHAAPDGAMVLVGFGRWGNPWSANQLGSDKIS